MISVRITRIVTKNTKMEWEEIKKGAIKPLGKKAYGSIPHLPGSRVEGGDHTIDQGQANICLKSVRDGNDIIIVQEKLDGTNCAVVKLGGKIIPLNRSGWIATDSTYAVHRVFAAWVEENYDRFDALLQEGERACGEFLAQVVSTKYDLSHEPFVIFDIMTGDRRTAFREVIKRVSPYLFVVPFAVHVGNPISIEDAMKKLIVSHHGAEEVEGGVWRVERNEKVDFLAKYVRHGKEDGKYLSQETGKEPIWNIDISRYKRYLK